MKRTLLILATLGLAAGCTLGAAAKAGRPPLGVRAGYTHWHDIDQLHLGGHLELGDILPNVAFTPGVEFGLGGGANTFALNGDVFYRATEISNHPWEPYVGANVAANWFDPDNGGTDTTLGLGALIGTSYSLASGNKLLGEIRIGLVDSPDLRLTCGYTFF